MPTRDRTPRRRARRGSVLLATAILAAGCAADSDAAGTPSTTALTSSPTVTSTSA
ncbi:hypothetical protein I0Q12_26645, partial [Rhodococcus sp. CX]|nr:hypothetical protein [Rhodococcus sp. CX]